MSEIRSVSILPDFTQEQAERIDAAIKRRDEADYQCFMALRDAQRYIGRRPDYDQREDVEEIRERVQAILEEREDANEEFLRAVAGRPPR